jgi:hypothetical protein
MAAQIVRLSTRQKHLRAEQAAQLRQLVIDFEGLNADAAGRIVAAIDRETAAERGWTFVQLNAAQNAFVVEQLMEHSTRPQMAARLWAKLFLYLRLDTNEIVATRGELAEEIGAHPNHVSAVLGELVRMRAVIREREGRHFRYFMNPLVGTGQSGAARDKAHAAAPALRLLEGGKTAEPG